MEIRHVPWAWDEDATGYLRLRDSRGEAKLAVKVVTGSEPWIEMEKPTAALLAAAPSLALVLELFQEQWTASHCEAIGCMVDLDTHKATCPAKLADEVLKSL
jgi:hypothetical protein